MTPAIKQASDHSLLVLFGEGISTDLHQKVRKLTYLLLSDNPPSVRNIHPGYNSVLISFDPRETSFESLQSTVISLLARLEAVSFPAERCIEIPVVYGGAFGPDLAHVASHNRIAETDVVRIHTENEYLVYFLGFSPGFPYMGGMSERIATPRLPSPRAMVPAGSVAIAGSQTGIYPVNSPGGWRIIGRTPLRLFDPAENRMTLLEMGDFVRFKQIRPEEFKERATSRS